MGIFNAVKNGNMGLVKEYINSGANLNIKNYYNSTLLHYAIIFEQSKIAKLLIKNGADLNIKNSSDYTPLQIAIIYDQPEVAELLVNYIDEFKNKDKLLEQIRDNINEDKDNAARWNKIFNMINGTKYGRGR